MKDNPKLRKNGGPGTFFGNLWRAVVKNNIPLGETIVDAIDKKDVGKIFESISNDSELTEYQKEILLANLQQDVTEMEEVTKRWQSDMSSDSWWSKNIRPLSLAFLTISLFLYIILDSALEEFKIDKAWIDLLSSLLLLVYGGYYGARAVEKVAKIRKN
ncbi:hypothetical protein P12024L_15 [Nonlabens phage P12024L]|uniref:Holin of 3TMs, for gene-transfer release n=1 Tax=Nonlabens phage P12024L TaxID=1168479 RepID=I6S6S3_9CAUD|nr:holin [Nonlabens phage P12024L]AFM54735.1 hypothetical protein P12024L_15 [Nonlabens phage P12024L]